MKLWLPLSLILGVIFFLALWGWHITQHSYETSEVLDDHWTIAQRTYPSGVIDYGSVAAVNSFRREKINNVTFVRKSESVNDWVFAGPTNIGGRITDIEIRGSDPNVIFVGSASGGLFRTLDNGGNWNPAFDQTNALSIGDIAISPTSENVMYVGTGEPNLGGGSITYDGGGVYKSTDGGSTWALQGLAEIGSVGRIVISHTNSNHIVVAAMGKVFSKSSERGVYRSSDGGSSWERVLYLNDSTGAIDLAMNPQDPNILYAAMWQRVRTPTRRNLGGSGSGIYRSTDGGSSWVRLSSGLPVAAGRIALAIAPSEPKKIYALITHPTSGYTLGFYSTQDGGDTWSTLPATGLTNVNFMWWFGRVTVDPSNPLIIYAASLDMNKSVDGGNTWFPIFKNAHMDQHAIAVHQQNPNLVLVGNDGGLYSSHDGGITHTKINNLPITQFYTCSIDPISPTRIYGGAQDNSVMRTLSGGLDDWQIIYSGDGFSTLIDPRNNNIVYAEAQYGYLAKSTDNGVTFETSMGGILSSDRKNWKVPVLFHPTNPDILFYGAHRVYKSIDRAGNWSPVSPDLTKGPGNGNLVYGTITAMDISTVNSNNLVAGADDGTVSISTNGSSTWQTVSAGLPNRWITSTTWDPLESNTLYVTQSGYRQGAHAGHIYKSTNLGNTWIDISGDLPDMPINKLLVAPISRNLYIATDIGVYWSNDSGTTWELLGTELPNVVISDLSYHAPSQTLLAATYGRGIYKVKLDYELVTGIDDPVRDIALTASPNPFINKVHIHLSTLSAGKHRITLHRADGSLIDVICDGALSPGNYTFEFDGSILPSGLYLCRLDAPGKKSTIKIIRSN